MTKSPDKFVAAKAGLWYTISTFITKSIAFLTIPVFARILSKSEFGEFTVISSWFSLLLIITSLELSNTLNKARFDFHEENNKGLSTYITTCLMSGTVLLLFVVLLYCLFPAVFDQILLIDHKYLPLLLAYLVVFPAFQMFQTEQRIQYKYKLSTILTFAAAVCATGLSLLLTLTHESDRLFGRVIGQFLPYVLLGLFFYAYYLKRSIRFSKRAAKYAVSLAVPIMLSYVSGQVLQASDKFVTQHMCSNEVVSLIGIATSFSHIMLLLVQSISSAWSPLYYDKLATKEYQEIKSTFSILFLIVFAGTVGVALLGPEIIYVMGGEKYMEAVSILPMYAIIAVLSLLLSQFSMYEAFIGKQRYTSYVIAIGTVFNLGLDIAGVPLLGYKAVCYATVVSYVLMLVMQSVILRKTDFCRVFDLKQMTLWIAAVIVIIPSAFILYLNQTVRYCIVVLYLAVLAMILLKNRALIKKILK